MNFGITAAYCDAGSCRAPKTLKYRRVTVSNPYVATNAAQYCSPVNLATAYGERGRGSISSCLGSSLVSPYADDEPAYTNRFTPASFAASIRLSVPSPLMSFVVTGSMTERGT